MPLTAGFIGLGNMGFPMAHNLIKNQVQLFVYNRTKEKALPLVQQGARLVGSPRELFQKTPIVCTMVSNDEALEEVTLGPNGLLAGGRPGAIHVSMSTVSPDLIHTLAEEHAKKGMILLSAPVFGRPEAAEQQKLWICLAGDKQAKKNVEPLMMFMNQKVFDIGEVPEQANVMKIAGNFLILSNVELLTEAFSFIQKSGADVSAFHNLICETLFSSPIVKGYGKRVIDRDFKEGGFRMELGFKDISLVLQKAEASLVPMPIANLLRDRLLSGMAKNRGRLDWTAIALSVFEDAGLGVGRE
jgi:3-hydroxyisobutyrate dehydrogenase-like beta-hydroxyacid dehydrogenase